MNKKPRVWTKAQMKAHGWRIYYYGGWHVDLNAPKGLSRDEHTEYLTLKSDYINGLCMPTKRRKK